MIRLAIAAEGQTEGDFATTILERHLLQYDIYVQPVLLNGAVSEDGLAREMVSLCRSFGAVTSLVDFYGFVKKGDRSCEELQEAVRKKIIERPWLRDSSKSVFPYIQQHEFESLLFSDTEAFGVLTHAPKDAVQKLRKSRGHFDPEEINDDENTAPSKRIQSIVPTYDKVADGMRVAREIGLEAIRKECPRFDAWVKKMEGLTTGR